MVIEPRPLPSSTLKNMAAIKKEEESKPNCHQRDEYCWRWYLDDPQKPIELSEDNLRVLFHPRMSFSCTGIRGDKPLHSNMEHWFQVRIDGPFHGQTTRMIGIGLKTTCLHRNSNYSFYPLIGEDSGSWGFNYTGKTHHNGIFRDYATIDQSHTLQSMIVGVYYNSYFGSLVFSYEGESLGLAFDNIPSTALELYPMVCSSSKTSSMKLLHCYSSISSLKSLCRGTIRMYINGHQDIAMLPLPHHLMAYLNYKHYEHPKDHHSMLDLQTEQLLQ